MVAPKKTSIIIEAFEGHHKIYKGGLNLEVGAEPDSKNTKDVKQLGFPRTSTIITPKYDNMKIDISMLGYNILPKIKVIKKKRDF